MSQLLLINSVFFNSTEQILEASGASLHPPERQLLISKPVSQLRSGRIRRSDIDQQRAEEESASTESNEKSVVDTTSEDDMGIEREGDDEKVGKIFFVVNSLFKSCCRPVKIMVQPRKEKLDTWNQGMKVRNKQIIL